MEANLRLKGFLLAIGAATLWGVSGTFAQFIFESKQINPAWLVTVRCLIAGTFFLAIAYFKLGNATFSIWKNKKDTKSLLLFSVFGMLAVQYTFFAAIAHSNAATATIL